MFRFAVTSFSLYWDTCSSKQAVKFLQLHSYIISKQFLLSFLRFIHRYCITVSLLCPILQWPVVQSLFITSVWYWPPLVSLTPPHVLLLFFPPLGVLSISFTLYLVLNVVVSTHLWGSVTNSQSSLPAFLLIPIRRSASWPLIGMEQKVI